MYAYSTCRKTAVQQIYGLRLRPRCWEQPRLAVRGRPFANLNVTSLIYLLAFSALRAYALSNRNKWLASLIILLALPPPVIAIVSIESFD